MMAQGQAGHTEKAEIRSKAMRTHLLFQGPFQIFSYQICFREAMEGAQLSNTKESTSSNRGVRRLAREAASSVSQARFVSFSFFSILFIFLPWHLLFFIAKGGSLFPLSNRLQIRWTTFVTGSRGLGECVGVLNARGVSSHAPCNLRAAQCKLSLLIRIPSISLYFNS